MEYIGTFPGNAVHGNASKTSQKYARTTEKQFVLIEKGLDHNLKPIDVKTKVDKMDPENPISLKVIQNRRYHLNKQNRPESFAKNRADEVQMVLNELKGNPFIRQVFIDNDNGKPPSIMCFSDEQIELMIHAILNGDVIGVDRTFNLGACYVTCLVFQNKNLV